MDSAPIIRKTKSGVYLFSSTPEAKSYLERKKDKPHRHRRACAQDQVHANAVQKAKELGLKTTSEIVLKGLYEVQFGKYQGQSFKWIVENDLGWVTYLVCQVEAEGGNTGSGALNDNKRQLRAYMDQFPDARAAMVQKKREMSMKAPHQRQNVKVPVSLLVNSSLPAHAVARRLHQAKPTLTPKISSSSSAEFDDEELLQEVKSLEASMGRASRQCQHQQSPPKPSPGLAQKHPLKAPLKLHTVGHVQPELSQADDLPLPEGWKTGLPKVDRKWISKAICKYNQNGKVEYNINKLWYYPPEPALIPSQLPTVDRYFAHALFVWMPRRMFRVILCCIRPDCNGKELISSGVYPNIRHVLDVSTYYIMVTEYLRCTKCEARYIGWSGAVLRQLNEGHRRLFPAVLSYKYACDNKVIVLMRTRGLGNSASQLQRKLAEQHQTKWLTQTCRYLSDCKVFADTSLVLRPNFEEPSQPIPVPKYHWLQTVYCYDVMNRMEAVKAAITSTFGRVLKMDSTKKIAKKLAGQSRDTATWATNVGNEYGQVLMSVLTCQEGAGGLKPMVDGIIARYRAADVSPPEVLYVDKDCCGNSHIHHLFSAWAADTEIRLDIWHFMRRFAAGCTTEAHQLYGVFMSRLSKCIFGWSKQDLQLLQEAKRSELQERHVKDPSNDDIIRWITKAELALHCRRQTRGTEETTQLIDELNRNRNVQKTKGFTHLYQKRIQMNSHQVVLFKNDLV